MIRSRQSFVPVLAVAMLACATGTTVQGQDNKEQPEKKSGSVVGVLTAKGPAWLEVKADGEQKARRYVANWVGGAPQDGGGPDKEMVKTIKELTLGSRVRLEWKFDERPRVVKVEVLTAAKEEAKKGTVAGKLVAKEKNWIEVKADGEEKARRYFFHQGGTKELHEAIKETAVGSRVRIEWMFLERPRILKMEVIKGADKDR